MMPMVRRQPWIPAIDVLMKQPLTGGQRQSPFFLNENMYVKTSNN
jgi:hypothetical protein